MDDYAIVQKDGLECYSPSDVVQILNYSKASTYRLFRSKSFPSFRVGEKGYRVIKSDFKKWQEEQEKIKEKSYI